LGANTKLTNQVTRRDITLGRGGKIGKFLEEKPDRYRTSRAVIPAARTPRRACRKQTITIRAAKRSRGTGRGKRREADRKKRKF